MASYFYLLILFWNKNETLNFETLVASKTKQIEINAITLIETIEFKDMKILNCA